VDITFELMGTSSRGFEANLLRSTHTYRADQTGFQCIPESKVSHVLCGWNPACPLVAMREKFYGLLREYFVALRERDLFEAQLRETPEGIEREQVNSKVELTRKRCAALRREIRRYPDINALPAPGVRGEAPPLRYKAQAG